MREVSLRWRFLSIRATRNFLTQHQSNTLEVFNHAQSSPDSQDASSQPSMVRK